jgi:hypothetical protein
MGTAQIPSVQYLLDIPPNLVAMWSARAIYTIKPEPFIDVLADRQYMYGENYSQEAKDLCAWLNQEGIKGLQAMCKRLDVRPNESRIVEYHGNGYVIRGNPNSSYGYLYIVAYRIAVEPNSN